MRTQKQKAERLLQVVAEVFKVTPEQMRGADRYLPIPEARATFWYLAKYDLGLTFEDAAVMLNKKRSTATQQGNKIKNWRAIYIGSDNKVDKIRAILSPESLNPFYLMAANLGGYEQAT